MFYSMLALATLAICVVRALRLKKRKVIKHEEQFFLQNGAALLKKQVSYYKGKGEAIKIFKAEELRKATNGYEKSQIVGITYITTIYKGTLDDHVVAIKNRALSHEAWIDHSISEIVILSQINHRNVVKLLGCCLETPVPSLILEFASNGTLYDHIHNRRCSKNSLLCWDDRLRICLETAEALAYLQSAFAVPIIHGDVKSSTILLDENLVAKISQFAYSRPLSMDQTEGETGIMGTKGYLDPECYETNRLTEKSNVYSFGVVLVEILTGRLPYLLYGNRTNDGLVMFVSAMEGNGLSEVMEASILGEGKMEQFLAVAELAMDCLQLKGESRPSVKEVAQELRRITC